MSEKEIKNNKVAGKKLEDLTPEELKQVQGQGADTDGETLTPTTIISPTAVSIVRSCNARCKW